MLSEQDKQEMLADAHSPERRESFRKLRVFQDARRPSLAEYCAFCESLAALFPPRKAASFHSLKLPLL
ncbi:MAG: hypothetical protein HQL22_04755 [Candidatus Omnitrophica bacterium]|nr:hypothetical protein [Candidatus Omnitrophota bacterium]